MRSVVAPLVKLALFATVTVLLTGVLGLTVANVHLGETSTYTAVFTDATGLNTGDDVRISGVRVGTVTTIAVADRTYAKVGFEVEARRRLPASATATIRYRNLLGQRYLALGADLGDPQSLRPGDTIPVGRTAPALNLTVLFDGFRPLFQALNPQDVNTLATDIVQVLQGEGGTIDDLLSHTASLTSTVAAKDQAIGRTIDNLNAVLDTVNEHGGQLSGLITQLQQLVSGLAAERGTLGDAIAGTGDLTNATAGLLADARPALRQDVDGLAALAQNLSDSSDLVEHFVQFLPTKTEALTRLGTYGSWFNYFACSISGTIGVSSLDIKLPVLPLPATERASRCGP